MAVASAHATEFLDPFTALDSDRWTVRSAGGGSVSLSGDSYAVLDSPVGGDAAFLTHTTPVDLSQSQTWLFALRRISGDPLPDLIGLWSLPSGSPPLPESGPPSTCNAAPASR